MRKNIYEIINNSQIDIESEYRQLHEQFFKLRKVKIKTISNTFPRVTTTSMYSIYELATNNFLLFSNNVRKRSGSLLAYNQYYSFNFQDSLNNFNLDKLISFCEYIVTFSYQVGKNVPNIPSSNYLELVITNSINCMDLCGYKQICKENIYCFIENKKEALAVAEIVGKDLSYTVLEYNHYKMKGDLERKKASLLQMYYNIELNKKKLREINRDLQTKLYCLFNSFIRHNLENNEYINNLSVIELESIYDDTYQMWLLAKLELDNIDRKKRISTVINSL